MSAEPSISSARAWILAARPKTLTAAIAPVAAGTGLAALHGAAAWLPALAALVGAVLIQIGTNLANDYYDFIRGGDTDERVGPVRVTQSGILPPETVRRGMVAVLAAAMLVGIYLVYVGGWPIVWIGLASVACAVLYTGGPFPLAYHGLGDVFVFVFFGLVAVGGTYWVQALEWPVDAVVAGVGLGALNTAILVVNNLRDIETDSKANKRTLAVRLGRRGTQFEYLAMLALGAAVPLVGVFWLGWPVGALLALAALVLAVPPTRAVLGFDAPRELLPALGGTARVVAVYGVLLGIGLGVG
ncbi:MAG: 1,4-dihydroxy-2-naphthoate polyprenyltransferase [Gemmatimonadetes bacterium]|nr:1,4-dihydroxy-2-naphthoate polyprenyltransferase [Gemmatimonadota bacterium]